MTSPVGPPRFETGEPDRNADVARALLRLHADSARYLDAIPTPEFFVAQGAKWSPAEHARHLHKSVRPLAAALAIPRIVLWLRFGPHRGASRTFAQMRDLYTSRLALGYVNNRYAPAHRDPPADTERWRREIMSRWAASVDALAGRVIQWEERDADRYRLPHPLLGKLSVREMLHFTLYHNAHHVRLVAERRNETTATMPGT